MAISTLILPILLGLLTLDSLIEVGFIGSMVGYLHTANHDVAYQIAATSTTPQFGLYPKPAHMLVNQGHTSNGAAGTALILVSWLGFLILSLEKRGRMRKRNGSGSAYKHVRSTSDTQGNTHTMKSRQLPRNFGWLYPTWVVFTVLSFLLTTSALAYTFIVTAQTDASHSQIDLKTAAATGLLRTNTQPSRIESYPDDTWTPENWYKQVLRLDFVDASLKGDIRTHVRLMEGWRWNLIPLFLLGFSITVLAVMGWMGRGIEGDTPSRRTVQEKHLSANSDA